MQPTHLIQPPVESILTTVRPSASIAHSLPRPIISVHCIINAFAPPPTSYLSSSTFRVQPYHPEFISRARPPSLSRSAKILLDAQPFVSYRPVEFTGSLPNFTQTPSRSPLPSNFLCTPPIVRPRSSCCPTSSFS